METGDDPRVEMDVVEDEPGTPQRLVPNPAATPEQLRLREAWLRSGSGVSAAR